MPLVAMFILFDFVVHNPRHQETRRNVSYLDIVAAHFNRLEWISDGWIRGVTVAEFAAVARQYVDNLMTNNENTSDNPMSGIRQRLGSNADGNDNHTSDIASMAQESTDSPMHENMCDQVSSPILLLYGSRGSVEQGSQSLHIFFHFSAKRFAKASTDLHISR